jgi:hypothetical protein
LERANPLNLEMGVSTMNQFDVRQFDNIRQYTALRPVELPTDFEGRMRFGLSEVLAEHPELREVLPLAAMMDDAVRWCA